ncbi:MAG: MFS transporter [Clostridia bacterium]|nr:MFS transporter [Clostridia bacterium]
MSTPNFKLTKFACYTAYFTMSSIFCVPPLLFSTFREMYGVSYTLLGTLVLINFCTQLGVDLLFTAFGKHFPIRWIVRMMPLITACGLLTYALVPTLFPQNAYFGLALGTVIFSVSAGLSEVLLSPTIAAIPSDTPQRDMSLLHSLYAFGVLTMVILSTVFFRMFGTEHWAYLFGFLALLPLAAAVFFMLSPMPELGEATSVRSGSREFVGRAKGITLCVLCIFFGSCAENAMGNWISTYAEQLLGIDKAVGDILGVAMFALLLGLARIGYARFGKNISRVLLVGMLGAAACYLVVALSSNALPAFLACVLTGLFVSMLWPGTLIMMEEKIPHAGVTAFALMAASGDLGASVAPQLVGVLIDRVSVSSLAGRIGEKFNIAAEEVGLRAGMLVSALFPLIGAGVVLIAMRLFGKRKRKQNEIP